MRSAGVPDEVGFATKPRLAQAMIDRAVEAGVPASWVTGDEVYGADPGLRADLQERDLGYVLAVASTHPVATHAGRLTAAAATARLPASAWQRYSAGPGGRGQRWYDWALIELTDADGPGGSRLLVRRSTGTGELAFYRTWSPEPVPLITLIRVAGRRWSIEEAFQSGKGLTALDQHQVRRWTPWHRWTVLAMLAHAFLSVITATERTTTPTPTGLIPLSRNEIQHLLVHLGPLPLGNAMHVLRWSRWRRRHQATARVSHYRRQAQSPR